jgi:hypothetical protein
MPAREKIHGDLYGLDFLLSIGTRRSEVAAANMYLLRRSSDLFSLICGDASQSNGPM